MSVMKIVISLLSMVLSVSGAGSGEKIYTASTPAAPVIRSFLGIPLADSIDFIRWKITFSGNHYTLHCNYGLSKPNTNGFINGGGKIDLEGALKKEKNIYQLRNGNKILTMAELNSDLLHLLDADNSLLIGNGGWSYAINNMSPSVSDQINSNVQTKQTVLKDSMAFEGRTPCGVPGIIAPGAECYKLKWYVVFYASTGNNQPTTYRLFGTPYRKEGGRKGNWKIVTGKDGRIIYQLYDESGKAFINMLKTDGNILVFTDANGKLLVGNEDFSYTLNKSASFLKI
jgi:hypothetical protein